MLHAAFLAIWLAQDGHPGSGQWATTVAVNPAAANQASSSTSVIAVMGGISIMRTPYRTGVTETLGHGADWIDGFAMS